MRFGNKGWPVLSGGELVLLKLLIRFKTGSEHIGFLQVLWCPLTVQKHTLSQLAN